ncbi:site-specific integrase [Sporosarcina aquimarina]|uniref:site-specific integrase n=1 Tax=Sporosarcina aquimarina TaxID=114975 RepID=UPI001C8DEDE7|nr:site-specific integrase [Sporosarcina aquimarina]MBY0221774.1 site-specific integrase [Sporosarcina aquimarina]
MAKKTRLGIESYTLANEQKRYKFQVYIGVNQLTGKQKRTTRRGFKTIKEAELALARIKLQIAKGTFQKQHAETYQNLYDLWIIQYEKTVAESTFVKTKRIFKNHILPAMGAYKVDMINIDVCQQHVNEWAVKLKSFRTVKDYAARVMDFALKREYIKANPFALVDMPVIKKNIGDFEDKEENYYTKEQLVDFLSCLENETNYKSYALFRLLAYSGMRKGEALALRWNDLNFNTNEIRINKALAHGEDNRLYVKPTKTEESRTIKMDKDTMKILAMWNKIQKKDYDILGFDTSKHGQLIFSNTKNKYIQPSNTRAWILRVQDKYHLRRITTHGLRHTHSTLLAAAGVKPNEIKERLGHSDIRTTMNVYTHVTTEAKVAAVEDFARYVNS